MAEKQNPHSPDVVDRIQAAIGELPGDELKFEQIIHALGQRSFGLAVLIFALPMIIPMPPGIPMAAGMVIALIAMQLIMGRDRLWLPQSLAQKKINRDRLDRAYSFAERYLGWIFHLTRRRLAWVLTPLSQRIAGVLFLTLAVLMVLPIPIIGNILPAFSCTILALGLTDRDGVFFVLGVIISAMAIASTLLIGMGTLDVLHALF